MSIRNTTRTKDAPPADMTSSTNGAGVTLTYAYNVGARLTSIMNGTTLLWGNPVHYNAAGDVTSATFGNNVIETRSYDARLRLTGITDGSTYSVTIPTYAPDSDVLAANDSVNGNLTYAYDAFNRLTGSNQNSGTNIYSYLYDRFGNRWNQNVTHGSGPGPGYGFDANNLIVSGYGVTYDAAGDTTDDGTTTYTYDAEGRVTTAVNGASGTSTYIYDAEGRRNQKTTAAGGTVNFVYDLGGHEVAQMNSAGAWTRGEVYAGGRHVATYTGTGGTTYFIHSDWLGTERARSAVNGTSAETCTSLPFGDWLTCIGSDVSPMHFTGKEHDWETGLENFGARYDASAMGRFMTPDAPFADQTANDPDSWNLYGYVRNDPLRFMDEDGRACVMGPDGQWHDDNSGGQSCKDANSPDQNNIPTAVVGLTDEERGLLELEMAGNWATDLSVPREGLKGSSFLVSLATGAGELADLFRLGGEAETLTGLYGTVSRDALEAAADSGGPTVRVVTNLTQAPQAGKALSVATGEGADDLANAARTGGQKYVANIPQALLNTMKQAGLATESTTSMGGVTSREITFQPQATEFVAHLFHQVP
jgi:RHS repeat-associated protein